MTAEPQKSLQYLLKIGRHGQALLFLGAGYSASSLNFSSQHLGVGEPLLAELSETLDYPYTDLQIAATADPPILHAPLRPDFRLRRPEPGHGNASRRKTEQARMRQKSAITHLGRRGMMTFRASLPVRQKD